jgi:hypothetical protein
MMSAPFRRLCCVPFVKAECGWYIHHITFTRAKIIPLVGSLL